MGLIATSFSVICAAQTAEPPCGSLANPFGPYDYRGNKEALEAVNRVHFTPGIESLTRPGTGSFAGDLDYTLRAFPNHHRALLTMARLAERDKNPLQANGGARSVECYFDRAVRFKPDDKVARMLYAQWLAKNGREADARAHLAMVAEQAKEEPFTQYNIGLLYLEMKAYDLAAVHAQKAMELGFPRTELRDRLRTAGKWTEPAAAAPGASAASATSAASN